MDFVHHVYHLLMIKLNYFVFFLKDTFLDVEESDLRYTYFLMLLRYIPELNVLIASTNIKQCLGWRYNNT